MVGVVGKEVFDCPAVESKGFPEDGDCGDGGGEGGIGGAGVGEGGEQAVGGLHEPPQQLASSAEETAEGGVVVEHPGKGRKGEEKFGKDW